MIDPQRIYGGEEGAFLGATLYRSLEAYVASADPVRGTALTPDLATDLGRPTDGGRTWAFTLRDGVAFQTGDPITCEDVKYGVSRPFATDLINQGPTYAIVYLDIPKEPDGSSSYKGPYTGVGQDLYDKAVECSPDHRTITFHLNRAVGDFNYTTTLGFSPVPKGADTGETYGTTPDSYPVSSGPYMVQQYTTGTNGRLVLVRNPSWNRSSDQVRLAYPDGWDVSFGVDPIVLDQRLIESAGDDAFALSLGPLQDETIRTVFNDAGTPLPQFAARAVGDFDPYARYMWINVKTVKNVKVRQAMLVALDRDSIREIRGGASYATFADGVVKPNIGQDYAPTGIWDTYFGQPVPSGGDPELARRLLLESGEPAPSITFTTPDTPINRRTTAVVIESLGKAGITVEYKPPCQGYCSIVFDWERNGADFGTGGWGADWPSASTVIPPLFTQAGGWDLSNVDDAAFNAAIRDVYDTPDRAEQARKWQVLNQRAVEQAWVIPTFFSRSYTLAGTKVDPIYRWPAYSSWPYGEMFVAP
jgi:peptide/nickel transport system substrate-binding protein